MLIIDRFEGNKVIIEVENEFITLPKSEIPDGAKEGDVLILTIDKDGTADRKKRIESMMNKLFKD